MEVVGYADPLSVGPGETVRFMVSTGHHEIRADLVRLIHGAERPDGPGFKERVVPSAMSGTFPGRQQAIRPGSYIVMAHTEALAVTGDLSIA
jgi:N,N-dimethylformamidase